MFYLLIIFSVHFLADFVMQTEWMALGKSKEWYPLLAHIFTYTITLLVYSILLWPLGTAVLWSVTNGLCHLVVDYFTSRAMRKAREANDNREFFLILGFDQLLHAWCLISTYGLFC